MIIDTSYFIYKNVFIPGSIAQPSIGTNTPTNIEALQNFISEKEYSFLLDAFGYTQTAELLSQFNEDGSWIVDAEQKWIDLVDGAVEYEWRGLRYTVGATKVSLIAYYVYFYFLGEDWKTYTTTGIQVPESANSETVVPFDKQAKAWNTFVKMYNQSYYSNQPGFFSNWNGLGMRWLGNNQSNEVDLYSYLQKRSDIYDVSKFKSKSIVNPNGL